MGIFRITPEEMTNSGRLIVEMGNEFGDNMNKITNVVEKLRNDSKSPETIVLANTIISYQSRLSQVRDKIIASGQYCIETANDVEEGQIERSEKIRF